MTTIETIDTITIADIVKEAKMKLRTFKKKYKTFQSLNTKDAFTLSEVLIAIVVIGVVAALTIPLIINNTNRHEYRSALKKAISTANNALEKHFALKGVSAAEYSTAESLVEEVFKKNTNLLDVDQSDFTNEVCQGPVFVTEDGIIFCVQNYSSQNSDEELSVCNQQNTIPCIQADAANLWIDVNGRRNPNKVTENSKRPQDIYQAQIYSKKVIPYGAPTLEVMYDKAGITTTPAEPEPAPAPAPTEPTTPPSVDPAEPAAPPEPTTPPEPTKPSYEDKDPEDITPDDVPDNPYDMYDPKKWPSWLDFLLWLMRLLGRIIFGP